ncbi:hypothetical protein LshimejAT787_0704870 [Lyophyllum shimeji]|uniref:Uncharacterized protein n=1 Tax=Lyophyllum shimeji TaxID=47721 RepID=A0A9P3PRC5_LYOSH|nr:hypothetical protein LshimejAT787_0704870 [Lyophyllum shimeji]
MSFSFLFPNRGRDHVSGFYKRCEVLTFSEESVVANADFVLSSAPVTMRDWLQRFGRLGRVEETRRLMRPESLYPASFSRDSILFGCIILEVYFSLWIVLVQ